MFIVELYREYKALSPRKKQQFRNAMYRRLSDYIGLVIIIAIIKIICWWGERQIIYKK